MVHLTLYSRPGCHLCDEMKAVIAQVAETIPVEFEQVDISTDPDLERRYGVEIPVLMIDGRLAAKYRVRAEELRRIVLGRSSQGGSQ